MFNQIEAENQKYERKKLRKKLQHITNFGKSRIFYFVSMPLSFSRALTLV